MKWNLLRNDEDNEGRLEINTLGQNRRKGNFKIIS